MVVSVVAGFAALVGVFAAVKAVGAQAAVGFVPGVKSVGS